LARGVGRRKVGAAFGVPKSTVDDHARECLPPKLARAAAERTDKITAATLLDAMVDLQRITKAQLDRAVAAEIKPAEIARLTREVRENVSLMGRFVGAFAAEGGGTVDNRVQVLALREMPLDELRALVAALRPR
jgi:hypothetical protein